MFRAVGLILIGLVVPCVSGCHKVGTYTAYGVVEDVLTGKRVADAKVELFDERGLSLVSTSTNEKGEFDTEFTIGSRPGEERTGWKLAVSAEGYAQSTVELGSVRQPKSGKEKTHLVFQVLIRRG